MQLELLSGEDSRVGEIHSDENMNDRTELGELVERELIEDEDLNGFGSEDFNGNCLGEEENSGIGVTEPDALGNTNVVSGVDSTVEETHADKKMNYRYEVEELVGRELAEEEDFHGFDAEDFNGNYLSEGENSHVSDVIEPYFTDDR